MRQHHYRIMAVLALAVGFISTGLVIGSKGSLGFVLGWAVAVAIDLGSTHAVTSPNDSKEVNDGG